MRVLIELGHPSHYYLFRNVIHILRSRGDSVLIAVKNREGMVTQLLERDKESYVVVGVNVPGLLNKALYMLKYELRLLRIARKFDPDIFLSMNSPYSAHVSFLLRKKHVTFADTEASKLILLLLVPFTQTTITPKSFRGQIRFRNHVRSDSYKVLAYLHPKYFTPDETVLNDVGVSKGEKVIVTRFSSYDASHDVGLTGMANETRLRLVTELSRYGKVIVSSEVELDPRLKQFEFKSSPERMLDLLAVCTLYVGEGATMACEAAVMGVPAIFIHRNSAGVLDDLEREGLMKNFHDPNGDIDEIIRYSIQILTSEELRKTFKERGESLRMKKEDLTGVIVAELDRYR